MQYQDQQFFSSFDIQIKCERRKFNKCDVLFMDREKLEKAFHLDYSRMKIHRQIENENKRKRKIEQKKKRNKCCTKLLFTLKTFYIQKTNKTQTSSHRTTYTNTE